MTLTQFEEVTRYLLTTFGKADGIGGGSWVWDHRQFSICASLEYRKDFFKPGISMFYNSPTDEKGRDRFIGEEWVDTDWFIERDLEKFIEEYQPKPLNYRKVVIQVDLEVPEDMKIDLTKTSPIELVRQYGVK